MGAQHPFFIPYLFCQFCLVTQSFVSEKHSSYQAVMQNLEKFLRLLLMLFAKSVDLSAVYIFVLFFLPFCFANCIPFVIFVFGLCSDHYSVIINEKKRGTCLLLQLRLIGALHGSIKIACLRYVFVASSEHPEHVKSTDTDLFLSCS